MPRIKEGAPTGASLADLEKYKADIRREIESGRAQDQREKDELRDQLKQTNEWINDRKKAEAKQEEVKSDKSTIVVPPSTAAPTPASETKSTNPDNPPSAKPEKRRLRWW